MEEESVHYFRISSGDRCESMAGKIDGFGKIDFMIKRIKKRGFEGLWIKVISGEIEGLESFHSLQRKNKGICTIAIRRRKSSSERWLFLIIFCKKRLAIWL